jgi:hypothetical protein
MEDMRVSRIIAAALTVAILSPPAAGYAHEDAVLRSPQSSVAAGDVLPLQGAEFEAGGRYTLRLVGPLREYSLGTIEADSAGGFTIDITIALDVVPGAYQVEAVASDGDVAARLDLTVLPAAQATQGEDGHAGAMEEDMRPGSSGMAPMARSDDIRIERNRSGIEWGLIGLLIGAAAGLGSGLLVAGRAGVR